MRRLASIVTTLLGWMMVMYTTTALSPRASVTSVVGHDVDLAGSFNAWLAGLFFSFHAGKPVVLRYADWRDR